MSHKAIINPGDVYGKLTVIEEYFSENNRRRTFLCRCECGNETHVTVDKLRSGHTKSCGRCGYKPIKKGDKFGLWTVISDDPIKINHSNKYLCKCGCEKGTERYVFEYALKGGKSECCGCRTITSLKERMSTHHMSKSRLFHVWMSMKGRCYNPNNTRYKDYGGRGIKVCEEWLNDFETFYVWSMANGYDENAKYGQCTIDRINVNENYCPDNCRWVNNKIQSNNKRTNVTITYNGETHSSAEWGEKLGIKPGTIRSRMRKNMPIDKVLYNGNLKTIEKGK